MTWMGRDEGRARENSPDDITRRRERERFFLLVQSVSPTLPYMGPLYRIPRHECGECMKRGGEEHAEGKKGICVVVLQGEKKVGLFSWPMGKQGLSWEQQRLLFSLLPLLLLLCPSYLFVCACLPASPRKKERREKIYCPLHPPPAFIPTPVFFVQEYRVGSIYVVVKSSFSIRVCWLVSFRSSEFELHSRDRKEKRASLFLS